MKQSLLKRGLSLLLAVTLLTTLAPLALAEDALPPATPAVSVTGVSLNKTALSLTVGGTELLVSTIAPADATNQALTWTSDNTAIATVDSGKVTAVSAGTTTITVITTDGSKTALCAVTVTTDQVDVLTATASVGSPLCFDGLLWELDRQCRKVLQSPLVSVTGLQLSSTDAGILHYGYVSADNPGAAVGSSQRYDYGESNVGNGRLLSRVYYVPRSDFSGVATIHYSGTSGAGTAFSGTIRVTVEKTEELVYTATKSSPALFRAWDFNAICQRQNGRDLDYVTFVLPDSRQGTLYDDGGSGGQYDSAVSAGTAYYRVGSPGLDRVSFVPADGYRGTVRLSYRGWDTAGNRCDGTVSIQTDGGVGSGVGSDTLSYTASLGSPARFSSDDFNSACRRATGYNLNYVRFDLPSTSRGTLYVNYRSDGNFDSRVSAGTNYSRGSTLDSIYFVPADSYTGTVTLSYTGWDTAGNRYTGTVEIKTTVSVAEVIRYSGTEAIPFHAGDFNQICRNLQGTTLSRVQFTLPDSRYGTLYYQYWDANATTVSATGSYYRSGTPELDAITFVPRTGYTGTVTLSYAGWDTAGRRYTGTVSVTVQKKQPVLPFVDMGSYGWATEAVAYLYEKGVVAGVTPDRYAPAADITRGAFVLMLCRGFDLPITGERPGFSDVPADSYCAGAVATAESLWIAQGSGGRFYPDRPLTRQDGMALIQRTMRATGWSLPDGSPSLLAGFSDRNAISPHAVGAVAALVELGIVQGDWQGRLNPKATLSRAEMAVILHRVLTL